VARGREKTAGERGLRIGENCDSFALFNDTPIIDHDDTPTIARTTLVSGVY
jgi:hypothetical protein